MTTTTAAAAPTWKCLRFKVSNTRKQEYLAVRRCRLRNTATFMGIDEGAANGSGGTISWN